MKIEKYDIVVANETIYQYIGKHFNSGLVLQDVHTKSIKYHVHMDIRKATDEETKWFCENTEHNNFINPVKN